MTRTPRPSRAAARRSAVRRAGHVALTAALGAGLLLTGTEPAAAVAVPGTPSGLPSGVEALQPYVGQLGCDPVAKPGVRAFSSMLLTTYRDTSSLGIVRDCGIGGASEHKEGRAFDWGASAYNPTHVAEVKAVTDWLLASDGTVRAARARRLGVMYMIWNRKIWKAYQIDRGWQDYTGPSPHTDHVHFSFGWNGARQHTSWWTKQVAPVDYGPYSTSQPAPEPVPVPAVEPVTSPDNIRIVATYGSTVLSQGGSNDPAAVKVVQTALRITADGVYGAGTASAVRSFQTSQGLSATGTFGAKEWRALFPRPVKPFGAFEGLTATAVRGWAADADTTSPISVRVTIDGVVVKTAVAGLERPEMGSTYPGIGTAHGYDIPVRVPAGTHQVCVVGVNVGAGSDASTGCSRITVAASPLTALSTSAGTAHVFSRGPAGDAERRRFRDGTLGGIRSLGGAIVGSPSAVSRASGTQEVVARGRAGDVLVSQRSTDGTYGPWKSIGGSVTSRPAVSARGTTGRVDLVVRAADGSLAHRVSTRPGRWGAPVSLGGKVLAGTAPALAWTPSGRLDVFHVGTDKQVWRKSLSRTGTWSRWEALGGVTTSDLTAVATSYAGVSVAVLGTDQRAYVRGVAAERGSGRWTALGGTWLSAPAIANAPGATTTQVFGVGTNGKIFLKTRTAGTWSSWVRVG